MPELTPPTPAVPLAALLDHADLGLRRLAGPDPGGVAVRWVHASEMADPVPYLLGGELLLTAGVHFPPADATGAEDVLDGYVARLAGGGVAALGFGVTPVLEETPRALPRACERYGVPLVEVPPGTPFAGVARAVWQLMAQARHRELRRVAQAQQGLAAAAAAPDPVPAVLRQLARRLGARACVLGSRREELYAAGPVPPDDVAEAMRELAGVVRSGRAGAPTTAAEAAGGRRLLAHALGEGGSAALVLAMPEGGEAGGAAIAGVAAVLLSLLTARDLGAASADRTSALVRLLLGADPETVAPLLSGAPEPWWTVVHGHRRDPAGPSPRASAAALATALGSPLADAEEGGPVRVLVPEEAGAPGREPVAVPGWTLGVSAPARTAELPGADAQAGAALRRAVASHTAVVRHRAAHDGIGALLPPQDARAYAAARLAPVAGSPALLETLRTWLALHGGWDRTAAALRVHRNTVRQRVARAADLLDADLNDPDVRADLWLALRHL
ncbi:PucR family transcriptional regulator [Streptantibioticus parmotrematis]|uniref:PucR family transcriptional regulator n=1 Tax=Streptantibioticus parmotrematis TaxID=2873249 RepID=UPI0033EE1D8E